MRPDSELIFKIDFYESKTNQYCTRAVGLYVYVCECTLACARLWVYTERTVQLSQLKPMHMFWAYTRDISLSQLIFRLPLSILQNYLTN